MRTPIVFHECSDEDSRGLIVLLPGCDEWLSVDQADKRLHELLRELHGLPTEPSQDPVAYTPPHPRHVPPSATADLSPTGSRTGNFTFTPGLRGDAA